MVPAALCLLLATHSPSQPATSQDAVLSDLLRARVAAAYDEAAGGFVQERGAPWESAVELALRLAEADASGEWGRRAETTLSRTAGLRDTIGGGYTHALARDGVNPGALDKRADSNARRLENLVLAWRVTGKGAYREEAARVVDFMERVLVDGRGGFVAAQVGDRELVPDANGFAIRAWLTWAAAHADRRRLDFARRSLDRVWETCWVPGLGLLRRGTFGEPLAPPQLADQVEFGRALLWAAHLGGRPRDRERAQALGDLLLARFEDQDRGGFRSHSAPHKRGVRQGPRLRAPSARAALFLCELSTLTGDPGYREAGRRAWTSFRGGLSKTGSEAADWALALRESLEPGWPPAPDWIERSEPARPARGVARIRTGAP